MPAAAVSVVAQLMTEAETDEPVSAAAPCDGSCTADREPFTTDASPPTLAAEEVAAPHSRSSSACALQDPYHCVAVAGCGFCLTSWTCMAGNASGPAAYALPCTYNASRFDGDCAWMADAKSLDACSALQLHHKVHKVPFELGRSDVGERRELQMRDGRSTARAGGCID